MYFSGGGVLTRNCEYAIMFLPVVLFLWKEIVGVAEIKKTNIISAKPIIVPVGEERSSAQSWQ